MPKYRTTTSRFVLGVYIHASPEHPVEFELPEGFKADRGLELVEEGKPGPTPALVPAHAGKPTGGAPTAAEQFGPTKKGGKGRASDKEPV